MTEDWTLAEIVRSLQRLELGQSRMEGRFDELAAGFVSRDLFEVELKGIRSDLAVTVTADVMDAELKGIREKIDDMRAGRAPWWNIVALVVSGVAVALPFLIR